MGVRLVDLYDQAQKEFGIVGRMKLAILTKTSSTKAQDEADSAENIRRFSQALSQLRLELKT